MARPHAFARIDLTDRLIGESAAIQALRAQIRHLAAFDAVGSPFVPTLLLHGETGTGKGLLARICHDAGPRASGPFLEVNCAAIPEALLEAEVFGFEPGAFTDARRPKPGLFEAASGGTLFLDEIDALPLSLQGKLLTVLEAKRVRRLGAVADRAVDVKLIAATQAELGARVAAGRFRADLYHRLAVVVLHLPALRERGDDVPALAQAFLARYAAGHGLAPKALTREALAWLGAHDWPGNVRELSHLMERVVLLHEGGEVDAAALERLCLPQPDPGRSAEPAGPVLARPAREVVAGPHEGPAVHAGPELAEEPARIRGALARTGGNVVAAARLLGLSRNALRYRMFRYQIPRPSLAGPLTGAERLPAIEPLSPSRPLAPQAPPLRDQAWPAPLRDAAERPPRHASQEAGPPRRRGGGSERLQHGEALEPTLSWEQRPVAVLAIDLTFPPLTGREAPRYEPWTLATRWEQALAEKVRGFGGVLLQRAPSQLTALFGLARGLEQLPQRAVQAALAIRHMVREAPVAADEAPTPTVRLAGHLGAVLVDGCAAEPTARLLAVGEALSLPVRLLGHAEPGDILVSPQVARLLGRGFELAPRALPCAAGHADRGAAYAVAGFGARSAFRAERRAAAPGSFVGRERELRTLHELLAQAEDGRGQVVGIVGESGLGKSRLLAEFLHSVQGRRITELEGRCLAYGGTVPYLPLLDVLRQVCGLTEASPETIAEKVRSTLRTAGLAPEECAPYLLRLLGVPAGTGPHADPFSRLSPEAIKARTFDTLRHLLLQKSRQRPLVVVIEDLHWLDQTSEACLATLVERLPGAPLLLLTTYRPGYRPPWLATSYATQLALQPLSPAESRRVIQASLPDGALPDALARIVSDRAEGNPFFLEELARAVAEHGHAELAVTVPATVQEVLLARIDRLVETPKRLLQTAAVLGREVSRRLLAAIWQEPGDLDQPLRELMHLEFLAEQGGSEEPVYVFKHALTQEVAYQSVPVYRRQALHAMAGRALETFYGDRLEEVVDRLAYHYAGSAEADKAVTYLGRVADRAARGCAHAEAAAALEEALGHVGRLPDREQDRRRLMLLLQLAHSLHFLGRSEESVALLQREQERVEQLADPALAGPYYFMLARGYNFLGAHEVTVRSARGAIEAAARCGDDATRGKAHVVLALEMYWAGRPRDGLAHGREAVSLLERTSEQFWLGEAYRALGFNYTLLGEFERALEACARAYAIGEAIGDTQLQGHAMWSTGWAEATRGEWTAGIAVCQQGLQRSLHPGAAAFTLGHLGAIYLEQGDTAEAVPLLMRAIEQASALGFRRARGWFTTFLAEAHRILGGLDRARELADEGLAIAREAQCGPGVGWAQRALGRIAQARGARAEAERSLEEALETFGAIGARFEVGRTHLALAELARAQAAPDAAARHVEEARRLFQSLRVPRYLERAEQLAEAWGRASA